MGRDFALPSGKKKKNNSISMILLFIQHWKKAKAGTISPVYTQWLSHIHGYCSKIEAQSCAHYRKREKDSQKASEE